MVTVIQTCLFAGCFELNERHTADNIIANVRSIMREWGIPTSKISGAVTDGGSNMVLAFTQLFGKDKHIRCFAHTLNLIVTAVFDDTLVKNKEALSLSDIIAKVKAIVTWFHTSSIASDELKKVETLALIQSTRTRWNSVYQMLERFTELSRSVSMILLAFPKAPPMVNATELEVIVDVLPLLALFDALTKDTSSETEVTISKLIPYIDFLCTQLRETVVTTTTGAHIQSALQKEIHTRFDPLQQHCMPVMATILDPRYKKVHFTNPLDCAKGEYKYNLLLIIYVHYSLRDDYYRRAMDSG
jgi:zinc finger BED domain-containing protein 1 (E3 SUMO-protein ligase ZBED1)